jgi:2-polyprenyl-3-methyl-5-hydroxy-6-metoxy-1,4-benzoquinol methylase
VLTVEPHRMDIQDGHRVLDVGCGPGRHSWAVCKKNNCEVHSIDIDSVSIRRAKWMFQEMDKQGENKGEWRLFKGSGMSLPFKDKSFDRIICSEVLEHVDDDQQVTSELIRVLKDDGVLAVSVPTYYTEAIFWRLDKNYSHPGGHIRKYRAKGIKALLARNNLHIYDITHKHSLHSIYWFLRCFFGLDREDAFIPRMYLKFLHWGMRSRNRVYRASESTLDHIWPKSIVLYTRKNGAGEEQH